MTVKQQSGAPPEGATLAIHIEMTTQVNVTAFVAQQKVTRFVITQISTQLLGDTPGA